LRSRAKARLYFYLNFCQQTEQVLDRLLTFLEQRVSKTEEWCLVEGIGEETIRFLETGHLERGFAIA
jgi:hypothetical protein